jgi:hypothetical protein
MTTKKLSCIGMLIVLFGCMADGIPSDNLKLKGYDPVAYFTAGKSVQKKWREKRDDYIASADKNWPELKAKEKKKEK